MRTVRLGLDQLGDATIAGHDESVEPILPRPSVGLQVCSAALVVAYSCGVTISSLSKGLVIFQAFC